MKGILGILFTFGSLFLESNEMCKLADEEVADVGCFGSSYIFFGGSCAVLVEHNEILADQNGTVSIMCGSNNSSLGI